MKRTVCFMFFLSIVMSLLVSCSDDDYDKITYRENGIEFFLPSSMRRTNSSAYDFYFTNISAGLVFAATKVDEKILSDFDLSKDADAGEYANAIIDNGGHDKEKMYFRYDERLGQYSMRYTYVDEEGYEVFYYVVILGDAGDLWYIEMCCDNSNSSEYIDTFDTWRKNIRTYTE